MVKIKDSNYLKSTDVKTGDIVELTNEGEYIPAEETSFGRETFEINIILNDNETKTWTMNKTTRIECKETWGNDSAAWVGKTLSIEIVKQNVKGQLKEVIYGHPIVEEKPQQQKLKK